MKYYSSGVQKLNLLFRQASSHKEKEYQVSRVTGTKKWVGRANGSRFGPFVFGSMGRSMADPVIVVGAALLSPASPPACFSLVVKGLRGWSNVCLGK
jgi:hypothetical protein